MSDRSTKKLVREGDFVAEVDVRLIEDESDWSPYLSPEDAFKPHSGMLDLLRYQFTPPPIDPGSPLGGLHRRAPYGRLYPP